jgi:hypothetical protein
MKKCKNIYCDTMILGITDKSKKSKTVILPYSKACKMGFLTGISSYYRTKENPEKLCPVCKKEKLAGMTLHYAKTAFSKKLEKALNEKVK